MDKKARDKLTKARAGLILDAPFWGSLALRLPLIEDPGCATMWTDGTRIGYDPADVEEVNLDVLKTSIAHEVMHVVLGHQFREDDREHGQFNMACDYALNPLLKGAEVNGQNVFSVPKGWLCDPQFADMGAEEIYTAIYREPEPDGKGRDGDGPGGGPGEVRPHPSKSPQERQQARQDWKVATIQAAQSARVQGHLPGNINRLVGELTDPKVPWFHILRQFVEMSARNDYNWKVANPRHIQRGFFLPSLISDELPDIVVAIDTSGSVDDDEMAQFATEISAVLETFDTRIHVVYCDTDVAGAQEFTQADLPLVLEPKGGGGTDFRPPFGWVEEQEITPACFVYLTDLGGTFPAEAPDYPVLWVSTTEGYEVPFGDLVEM